MKPRSYNPLDYASLSETLARELMSSDLMPMSQIERFYDGDFPHIRRWPPSIAGNRVLFPYTSAKHTRGR